MLRPTVLALASLLFLLPGNLVATVLQTAVPTCEAQGCGCPAPDPDDSSPAWSQDCCCQAQPAPVPENRPSLPLQTPQESPRSDISPALVSAVVPGADLVLDRGVERPAYLAHAPPDPLFQRRHVLRL